MQPLDPQPALIDRAYERLVGAIADGTLAPGRRIRQEELGRMLGVSRQPVGHALQLLKQQRLVEENGRRGRSSRRSMLAGIRGFTRFALRSTRWRRGLPPSGSPTASSTCRSGGRRSGHSRKA